MEQYKAIKAKYPNAILLFRVGDFYETFGEDAKVVSQVTGIILSQVFSSDLTEMAGFPIHALNRHLKVLVKAGHKVAICEQLENPKTARGMVKRGVTDYFTP